MADITSLNKKLNVPLFLTKLGADPSTIRKLNGNDYRCPCFHRGGDNPHGLGITYHAIRERWLFTDFLHHTCGNIDAIDFAVKLCGYSFKKALALLEECSGKELSAADTSYSTQYEQKDSTIPLSVLELFEEGLHPYMHERGYKPETVKQFNIGYATVGDLIDRITIPVVNEYGELVAVQGRTFVGDEPKYLYLDGSGRQAKDTLYNLYYAKEYIKQKGYVIVVEGAMSVMRAWQYGLKNVVATLSTSVTERQLALLKQLGVKIIIAFDFDTETHAGQLATLKLAKRLKEDNFKYGVYSFNLGKLGLSGAIDDLTPMEVQKALKSIIKLL